MIRRSRTVRPRLWAAAAGVAAVGVLVPMAIAGGDPSFPGGGGGGPSSINHIVVIDLENEGFSRIWGPSSPATYLNGTLRKQVELIDNYYGIGHNSLDNYIAQVSGQSPTDMTKADCSGTTAPST